MWAINVFTSADPQYTSLRECLSGMRLVKTGATALLSTSALMSPASDRDDPKTRHMALINRNIN